MIQDIYEFGICGYCGKDKPLKNKVCVDCEAKVADIDMSDFLKNIFKGFGKGD